MTPMAVHLGSIKRIAVFPHEGSIAAATQGHDPPASGKFTREELVPHVPLSTLLADLTHDVELDCTDEDMVDAIASHLPNLAQPVVKVNLPPNDTPTLEKYDAEFLSSFDALTVPASQIDAKIEMVQLSIEEMQSAPRQS
ncbi:hypothetical protein AMAG_09381 [Allomyces macrogynus ATCC 38327]|uniref:Uncharacterized protein n=1 Tax=Allomyces macrogynus (strain ATCC 38327) TaxID=578462 RepID=A0A0L0SPE7_ALLM3|nr:hypothetical protein AMAG_09381 [Allomyces macrogynus ATCC 38327]|eukprot:KNE64357.1 hypothetical protein AMAG_09381 [Allomyces macrogynus ATCC 38327]